MSDSMQGMPSWSTIPEDADDETEYITESIDTELTLNEEEKARLIFHSFANLLNVLLGVIGKCRVALNITDGTIFDETLKIVTEIGKSLSNLTATIALLFKLPVLKHKIEQEIAQAKQIFTRYEKQQSAKSGSGITAISKAFWKDIRWIEQSLLPIVELRTKELTQRLTLPGDAWVMYKESTLKRNMEQVILAVAKGTLVVSGIVFDEKDRQSPTDMVIELKIKGVQSNAIHLPPVFQDVMRDLIMNARKYSLPGALIKASMVNDGSSLTIEVKDDGMGIGPEEIGHIIEFGVRGSNVANRRTLGGGYGLTKAYFFTKQFSGSFTVTSAVGIGTTITINIPCPNCFRLMVANTTPAGPPVDGATTRAHSADRATIAPSIPVHQSALAASPKELRESAMRRPQSSRYKASREAP